MRSGFAPEVAKYPKVAICGVCAPNCFAPLAMQLVSVVLIAVLFNAQRYETVTERYGSVAGRYGTLQIVAGRYGTLPKELYKRCGPLQNVTGALGSSYGRLRTLAAPALRIHQVLARS